MRPASQQQRPTGAIRGRLERHSLLIFFSIAFAIPLVLVGTLVFCPELYYAIHGMPFDIIELVNKTAAKLEINFQWELYKLVQLCLEEPVLWTMIVYGAAPTIAAVIVAGLVLRNGELHLLLSRLKPWRGGVTVSRGVRVWGSAIALMVGADFVTLAARWALGLEGVGSHFSAWNVFSIGFVLTVLNTMFLDQGGLLEESGWRGFALPRLQEWATTPLGASLFLGTIWALWHIPRDIALGYNDGSALSYGLILVVFLTACLAYSIVLAFFFNLTGGSTLIAIAFHGMINDNMGLAGLRGEADLTPLEFHMVVATRALPYVLAALVIIVKFGKSLGSKKAEERQ